MTVGSAAFGSDAEKSVQSPMSDTSPLSKEALSTAALSSWEDAARSPQSVDQETGPLQNP